MSRNCADVEILSVVGAFPPNAFPLAKRTIYSAENGVVLIIIIMIMIMIKIEIKMMMMMMMMMIKIKTMITMMPMAGASGS